MQRVSFTVLICATLLTGSSVGAQSVWRGPYLNNVTTDAISIVWETPSAQTAIVRWGLTSALEQPAINVPATDFHQSVRLTGLEALAGGPDAEFFYELEVGGVTRGGTFHTEVAPTTPFAFIVYGDNRSNPTQHQAVADAILSEPVPVRFLVSTGDMVSSGQNEDHWDVFFTVEEAVIASIPIHETIGNHEEEGMSVSVTERIFEPRTDLPPASNTDKYYHFVYGNVEIIVLDGHTSSLYRLAG